LCKVLMGSVSTNISGAGDPEEVLLEGPNVVHDYWKQLDTIPINPTDDSDSTNM
jgi:hypothetical protein